MFNIFLNLLYHTCIVTIEIIYCQNSIEELSKQLTTIVQFNHKVDGYNPFANESKNIYIEPHILKEIIEKLNISS